MSEVVKLCGKCKEIPPRPGHYYCAECRDYFRAWRAKNYKRLRRLGRCGNPACTAKSEPGKARCRACLALNNALTKAYRDRDPVSYRTRKNDRIKKMRASKRKAGLCCREGCKALVAPGRARCPIHLETARKEAKRAIAKRKAAKSVQCERGNRETDS